MTTYAMAETMTWTKSLRMRFSELTGLADVGKR